MINWQEWKLRHEKELWHIAGFEEAFVDRVISQIPQIQPIDVQPQYKFYDDNGKTRYIDFLIINKAKGYMLPIELDGLAKDQNQHDWGDFLKRQNALITKFGIVLRFTNRQMFDDPNDIIHKIQQTLSLQNEKIVKEAMIKKTVKSVPTEKAVEFKIANEKKYASKGKWLTPLVVMSLLAASMFYVIKQPTNISAKTQQMAKLAVSEDKTKSNIDHWEEVPEEQLRNKLNKHLLTKSYITSDDAKYYNDQHKTTCGTFVQLSEFSKGMYLNFDLPFPKTQFTAVIWDSQRNSSTLSKELLLRHIGKTICVTGKIATYKNRQQTIVNTPNQLNLNGYQ
ncbi:hypothetical protein AAFX30_08255 [Vibrio chagasii]|uniref:hypothetical protein n=1 Tax=Vibrio chagasii TaxID=170679 RepID=UPI0038CD4881